MKIKVLIVDDHPAVRLGLKALISEEEEFEVVGDAASVREALEIATSMQPDAAIVDLSFEQGRSGLELVQQLSEEMKVLVCSYHDERIFAERALAAGARGYIQKSEVLDEVVQALRRIMDDDVYLSPRMSQYLLKLIGQGRDERIGSSILELTNREIEVFELLGRGYETREIAERLHLSPKTIAKHCENIMAKLKLKSRTKLLYHAILWVREERST